MSAQRRRGLRERAARQALDLRGIEVVAAPGSVLQIALKTRIEGKLLTDMTLFYAAIF